MPLAALIVFSAGATAAISTAGIAQQHFFLWSRRNRIFSWNQRNISPILIRFRPAFSPKLGMKLRYSKTTQ
jgi:hypothetical protein